MSMTMAEAIAMKEVGLDRWSRGIKHHPLSIELMAVIRAVDLKAYDGYFDWRVGGDGDTGETLMYQMDAYFEAQDAMKVLK